MKVGIVGKRVGDDGLGPGKVMSMFEADGV